jgi:hypothetical protein
MFKLGDRRIKDRTFLTPLIHPMLGSPTVHIQSYTPLSESFSVTNRIVSDHGWTDGHIWAADVNV